MNVQKMRKQMARNTPDAVWRTVDVMADNVEQELWSWQNHWANQMRIKHRGKDMELTIFISDLENFGNPRYQRYQMTCVERKSHERQETTSEGGSEP